MKFSAPVPERFQLRDWSDYDPPQEAQDWIDALSDALPYVGFSLLGPPGTGKTTAACWTAIWAREVGNITVGYTTSLKYQHALQERISIEKMAGAAHDEAAAGLYDRHENITGWTRWLRTECSLLVFDDWGKEHTTNTGFVEDEIEYLLRDRYDRGSPTILTSNMGTTSIKSRFGESMASFIWEAFPPVVLDGADRRRR